MFGILTSLTKAVVGVVIETPISIVADIVTVGGELTGNNESYTIKSLSKVVDNISDATDGE